MATFIEVIAFIAMPVTLLIVWRQLSARLDRQRDYILELDDDIQFLLTDRDAMSAAMLTLQQDVDELASVGPQPVSTAAVVTVKPKIVSVDNGNVKPLESDTLSLHGHTVIIGQSGSGKSNLAMTQIMARLAAGHKLYCIDTKRELAPIFGRHMDEVVRPEAGEELIRKLLNIASERQLLFEQASEEHETPVRDIGEYFRVTGTQLPLITLVVEELIVLMPLIGQDLLIALLVLGRSAGVFVLAMAQYLKADILDRKGSVNFNTSVFLGKFDRISVGILFGNLEKDEQGSIREFVGPPGKAAVSEQGKIRLVEMPRVYDYHLQPYMQRRSA